jgi:hypothetical protein
LDRQELLWFQFARPTEIDPGSPEDIAIQLTEGWVLGSSPIVRRTSRLIHYLRPISRRSLAL